MTPRTPRLFLAFLSTAAVAIPTAAQDPFRLPQLDSLRTVELERLRQESAPPSAAVRAWVAELSHPQHGRREAAVRQLVAAGPGVLNAVRPLCSAVDPALALTAERVFAQVAGTDAATYDKVMAQLNRGAGDTGVAQAITALGDGATGLALRHLEDLSRADTPLFAALQVHHSLHQLASGSDLDGTASRKILDLGPAAAEPLSQLFRDGNAPRAARLHACWLHASVGGASRATALAPLLADGDATVRDTALSLALETARADDFEALALAIGRAPSPARDAVALALAPRMATDQLTGKVRRGNHVGTLAAVVLGMHGSDDARDALIAAVESLGSSVDESEGDYAEGLVGGLARHAHEDSTAALANLFANADLPRVRAAATSALRHRLDEDSAATCVTAALFDPDPAVRTLAADCLATSGRTSAVPALVAAAGLEQEATLRSRTLAAIRQLADGGPSRGLISRASDAGADGADRAEAMAQAWRTWLRRQGVDVHQDELPWYRGSAEGSSVVEQVRERIHSEFFHFGDTDKVDKDTLDAVGLAAMRVLVADPNEEDSAVDGSGQQQESAPSDPLVTEGFELQILRRMLASAAAPGDAMVALGTVPFAADASDLVRLTNAAVGGMAKSLGDRYSRVQASNDPDGSVRPGWLPGLVDDADAESNGFYVEEKDGAQRVGFVLFDSPAYYADVQVGDQLVRIGDDFAADIPARDLRKRLNSADDFHFLREGWTRPYAKPLVPVKNNPDRLVVHTMLPGNLGYVRLKQFEAGCSSRIENAIKELEKQGAVGFVLDLRNNPGGTVIDATNIVDLFLPEGRLICTNEYRDGLDDTRDEEVRSTSKGADREAALVILVNGSSASASEMTSGSLQGNGRAKVIGQQSFGKGIGQNGANVSGFSSDTALGRTSSVYSVYLTMMRYYLPETMAGGRRSIHGVGVTPDIPTRERNLRGSRFDSIMRANKHKSLLKYVDDLLQNQRELCIELAVTDGEDPSRYPELDAVHDKVKRWVSLDDTRQLVRGALRGRLLADADAALFAKLLCDVYEDRTLQTAIRELGAEAGADLTTVAEYGSFLK